MNEFKNLSKTRIEIYSYFLVNHVNFLLDFEVITMIIALVTTKEK